MSDPYLSQITLLPFDWPPVGYSRCDGTLLGTQQNPALYALLGLNFGGNGNTTFALPDLRGRAALHDSSNIHIGTMYGQEGVRLMTNEMPTHTHTLYGQEQDGTKRYATDTLLARPINTDGSSMNLYRVNPSPNEIVTMDSGTCSSTGTGAPHNNMQPSIVMNFCIAVEGLFPSRN